MKINMDESSTTRGFVGMLFVIVGIGIIIFDDNYAPKISALLLVGKFVSDFLKMTMED